MAADRPDDPNRSDSRDLPAVNSPIPGGNPGATGPARPQDPSVGDSQLHENALGRLMLKVGDMFRDYGNWIVVGLVVLAVLVWAYRLRTRSAEQAAMAAQQGLFSINDQISGARSLQREAPTMTADELGEAYQELNQAWGDILTLTRDAENKALRAHALRMQGDYYWTLATIPPPQPATRPAEEYPAPPNAQELLSQAESVYQQVVDSFVDQRRDVRASLFGLAAIAEERGNFTAAGQHYDTLLARTDLTPSEQQVAQTRRQLLNHLSVETRLAPPLTHTDAHGLEGLDGLDLDAILQNQLQEDDAESPATQPTTQPTTQPSP